MRRRSARRSFHAGRTSGNSGNCELAISANQTRCRIENAACGGARDIAGPAACGGRTLEKAALRHYIRRQFPKSGGRIPWRGSPSRTASTRCTNRFELVLLSAHRARMISNGSPLTVDRENDKNPVVALREIADETVSPEDLNEDLIHSLQKYVEVDEPEPAPTADRGRCARGRGGDHLRPHVGGGAAPRPGEHRSARAPRRLSFKASAAPPARAAPVDFGGRPAASAAFIGMQESPAIPILLIGDALFGSRGTDRR